MSRTCRRCIICRSPPRPTAWRARRAAVINNPTVIRHIAKLAEWQKDKVFDYSGRATSAAPRFQRGECGIFLGSSATARGHHDQFQIRGRLRRAAYWPDVAGAPQNTIIGGATLWVLRVGRTPSTKVSRGFRLCRARSAGVLASEHGLSADHAQPTI